MHRSPTIAHLSLALCAVAPLAAQIDWTVVRTRAPLGERAGHAMVYDEARGETVIFGGNHGPIVFGDTWIYDGSFTWSQKGVTGPAARSGHAMVYDPVRQVVVLFGGGVAGIGANNETWEWDGLTWTQRFPATTPPPRIGMAAAPWPALGGVLIHGGFPSDGTSHFWLWDGVDWRDLTTATTPSGQQHDMAYHAGLQELVLLGPDVGAVWDGLAWRRTDGGTPYRAQARLAYDATRDQVIAFGGHPRTDPYNILHDTWAWRGLWAKVDTARSLLGRTSFDMVFDRGAGRTVMYGGYFDSFVGGSYYADAQALAPSTRPGPYSEPAVAGFGFDSRCEHVGDGVFSMTAAPTLSTGGEQTWINDALRIYLEDAGGAFAPAPTWLIYGTSNQSWNGQPLPISLNALGRPRCQLLVDVLDSFGAVARARALWQIQVPNLPVLAGSPHYFQALGFSSRGRLFTTNAIELTLGIR